MLLPGLGGFSEAGQVLLSPPLAGLSSISRGEKEGLEMWKCAVCGKELKEGEIYFELVQKQLYKSGFDSLKAERTTCQVWWVHVYCMRSIGLHLGGFSFGDDRLTGTIVNDNKRREENG